VKFLPSVPLLVIDTNAQGVIFNAGFWRPIWNGKLMRNVRWGNYRWRAVCARRGYLNRPQPGRS
jgi:hypothetical protein